MTRRSRDIDVNATGFDVPIAAVVTVPAQYVAAYTSMIAVVLPQFFSSLPIGGIFGKVQYNDVIGVLYGAGVLAGQGGQSVVQSIGSLTLNGVSGDMTYPDPLSVAELITAPSITVRGV